MGAVELEYQAKLGCPEGAQREHLGPGRLGGAPPPPREGGGEGGREVGAGIPEDSKGGQTPGSRRGKGKLGGGE